MSWKATEWARSQTLATRPGDRHILLLMADRAGDDGDGSFPSVATLAAESGYSERTVQRILKNLIAVGAIAPGNKALAVARIKRADRRPNVYRLCVEKTEKQTADGVTSTTNNGVTSVQRGDIHDIDGVTSVPNGVTSETERGDTAMSPEPPMNHPKEPYIGTHSRACEADLVRSEVKSAPTGATMAGAVCVALRADGLFSVNPSHPKLHALLERGAGIDAFLGAWRGCRHRATGNPFAYVLAVVDGQMQDAQRIATAEPARPQRLSASGSQTLVNAASLKEKLFKRVPSHA